MLLDCCTTVWLYHYIASGGERISGDKLAPSPPRHARQAAQAPLARPERSGERRHSNECVLRWMRALNGLDLGSPNDGWMSWIPGSGWVENYISPDQLPGFRTTRQWMDGWWIRWMVCWLDFTGGGARLRRALARSKRKDEVLGKIAPSWGYILYIIDNI